MFRNTIAVGPLEPTEFCVTGGVCTVARHLAAWVALLGRRSGDADVVEREKLLESFVAECRRAMATKYTGMTLSKMIQERISCENKGTIGGRIEPGWKTCPCVGEEGSLHDRQAALGMRRSQQQLGSIEWASS